MSRLRARRLGGGRRAAESGSDEVEGLGYLLSLVVGVAKLLGDVVRQPVPLGPVLIALDDLGTVAQLVGDLPQDRRLLLGRSRGVRGLHECIQGGGQRLVVGGEAEKLDVQCLGDARDGSASAAVAVLGWGLSASFEADGHVTGCGTGAELVGEGLGEIVCCGGVGRRRDSGS